MLATMSQRFRVASRVGAAGRGAAAALAAVALASCTTLPEPAVRSAAAAQTPRAAATVPAATSAPPASPAPSASGPVATAPGGAVPTPRPPGTPSAAAPVSPLRPFAEVIRDARRTEGVLAFWQKDDRVWIELRPQDFDQPFMLASKSQRPKFLFQNLIKLFPLGSIKIDGNAWIIWSKTFSKDFHVSDSDSLLFQAFF